MLHDSEQFSTILQPAPASTTTAASATPRDDDRSIFASVPLHASTGSQHSDHESEVSDDVTPPALCKPSDDDGIVDEDPATCCVICFERASNVTLDPCGHANLCDVCVSRLVKRRCPTCRARARKVAIRSGHTVFTKAVREVIAERKQRETNVLKDTLQIVFLGPDKVGKKALVHKLISKYPLTGSVKIPPASFDVFSDGTDFSANSTIAGSNVRLTVLRRTTLTSRRMVLDDIRVLKPDVIVLCCSAHVGSTFDSILTWDKVLRNNIQKPRVWALLALDDADSSAVLSTPPTIPNSSLEHLAQMPSPSRFAIASSASSVCTKNSLVHPPSLDSERDVIGTINSIFPPDLRPKKHYFCSADETFSVGFRTLAKDMINIGREARYLEMAASIARDEELAASLALSEARNLANQEAAGTLDDQAAANLVIANNGIAVPGTSNGGASGWRNATQGRSGTGRSIVGRSFSLRGLRERSGNGNGNGSGVSLSGIYQWLTGSHES